MDSFREKRNVSGAARSREIRGMSMETFNFQLALRAGIEPALAVPETAVLSVERSKHALKVL